MLLLTQSYHNLANVWIHSSDNFKTVIIHTVLPGMHQSCTMTPSRHSWQKVRCSERKHMRKVWIWDMTSTVLSWVIYTKDWRNRKPKVSLTVHPTRRRHDPRVDPRLTCKGGTSDGWTCISNRLSLDPSEEDTKRLAHEQRYFVITTIDNASNCFCILCKKTTCSHACMNCN